MCRLFACLIALFISAGVLSQQNTDNAYRKPLKEVLSDIEKKYDIKISYTDTMVAGKWVNYADWRYRNNVEITLDNVLEPLDMKVKRGKDNVYKLSYYEYYRWPVEEGWAELDRIAAQYNNVAEWEKRKQELKPCLLESLQLSTLPAVPNAKPVITPLRKFSGYTVENIALEILPGLWINGSLYKPAKYKGKVPVILNPDGHWEKQRYRPDCQYRCAALARMGAMAFSYDLFAWGESQLQFKPEDHRRSLAMTIQVLGSIRILDYLLSLKDADISRVAMTGGSGAGSHTVLLTAIDDRIKVSAPVVSLSAYFYGGCPCESGMPVHSCAGRTDNVEIAAMAAPRPQLVVSDGGDWTDKMPEHDFPYLQRMYSWYGKKDLVSNVHLPDEKHDFGISKRTAVYEFMARHLGLNLGAIQDATGKIDESTITIEPEQALYVFGDKGELLPAHAIKGFENVEKLFAEAIKKAKSNRRYKIGLIDLMLLKRQKPGAITLAKQIGADGVEVDLGGLGNRPTFDNKLLVDSIRKQFLDKARELDLEIFSLGMTGYYAQSFCNREEYKRSVEDCITTMKLMNVNIAFLPLGIQCDLKKTPAVRDSVVTRLKVAGSIAEKAGVVIGIETALSAREEVQLLKEIGSPAIKIYFNFSNPLKEGRDLIRELKILGKDRICMIHATNKDSVWLQHDPQIDMYQVKKTLDEMGWSGWLVIERSRDAKKPSDVKGNYGANTAYLKRIFQLIAVSGNAVEIYVATNGSDTNAGTKDQPLATIATALRKARELRRLHDTSVAGGIHIILGEGNYQLYEPIFFRPEDSGTATSPTYIETASGEKAVLSGGIEITGWEKLVTPVSGLPTASKGKIWVADMPLVNGRLLEFRQLWVNDAKAVRAKSVNGELMHRILNWNKTAQTCWIPTPKSPSIQNVQGIEMFIHQWWAIAILRIKKMEVHGDSTQLFFHQPESKIQSEHPWPTPWISKETGNSAFYLMNALQFLDEPGEWYLDIAKRKLYYWPRSSENLVTATVIAPVLETLVRIQGTIDNPVANVYFKGISFQHTGWLRPSQQGHVPHQAGMYMLDAYKLKPAGTPDKNKLDNQAWIGRPAAAVEVSFADKTGFENCRFEHLASTGLDYYKAVHDHVIRGNLFKDIGGTAILAGVYSDEATEIHLPYNPKDEREICDKMIISNNLITDVTNEDWSCTGIGAGYVRNATIEHNEVENVSYTGISMGWGWSPTANAMKNNKIIANKIHHYGKHNYDCGGIYTLSAQPGAVISENYIDSIYKAPYAHLPSHWFYIYTDEGSSYFTIKNNWTPSQKYLQNANGPDNEWINNGQQVIARVKEEAGIQLSYRYLLKEKATDLHHLPVSTEHYEVIELVVKQGQSFDLQKLKQILHQNEVDTNAIYRWQDHYVIFYKIKDVLVLQGRIQNNFPGTEVKVYHDMFYEFNRNYCGDKKTAKEWDHILLTANLVPDKKLQQEYVDYHNTQFKKWPEVAKGFCNADFQQLLLYRNGRQLMLVISIPKGENLDTLNPKTTANNPKVNEWNRLMKKYQEGIEGARKRETWVFLKKLAQ